MQREHRRHRLRVEDWELRIIKQVVKAYRTEREELQAELFERFLMVKRNDQRRARNWKCFLARSLYNAANNFVRNRSMRRMKMRSIESMGDEANEAMFPAYGATYCE